MSIRKSFGKLCEFLGDVPVIGGIFKPRPKVSVLRLSGIIAEGGRKASISYARYEKSIEQAFDVHKLKAVALVINSPGGSPAQSALVANAIRKAAEKEDVPVYAFIEDVAASGGYWLACAADEIYGTDVSIVGSIGVISAGFGLQDLISRYGIERRVHTAGKEKSFLDPFTEEKPADVKRLKDLQKDLHESFKDWVRTRRSEKLEAADKDIFEGQIWLSAEAQKLGIIDGTGDIKTVCEEKFGEDVKLSDYSPDRGLLSNLLSGARFSLSRDIVNTLEERSLWSRYGL